MSEAAFIIATLGITATRRRYDNPTRDKGRFSIGAYIDTEIVASFQSASGRVLERIPEADRTKENVRFFTTTELRTVGGESQPADRVVVGGKVYEVMSVAEWPGDLGHFDVLATRRPVEE